MDRIPSNSGANPNRLLGGPLGALDAYGGELPLMPILGEGLGPLPAFVQAQREQIRNNGLGLGPPLQEETGIQRQPDLNDSLEDVSIPSRQSPQPGSTGNRLPSSLRGGGGSLLPSALPMVPTNVNGNFHRSFAPRAPRVESPQVGGLATGASFSSTFPIRNFGGQVADIGPDLEQQPQQQVQQPLGQRMNDGGQAPLRMGGVFAGTSRNAHREDVRAQMTPPQMLITDPAMLRRVQDAQAGSYSNIHYSNMQSPSLLTQQNMFDHDAAGHRDAVNANRMSLTNSLTSPADQHRQISHLQGLAMATPSFMSSQQQQQQQQSISSSNPSSRARDQQQQQQQQNGPRHYSYFGGENDSDSVSDAVARSRHYEGTDANQNAEHPHQRYRHAASDPVLNRNSSFRTQQQQHQAIRNTNTSPTSQQPKASTPSEPIIRHPHDLFRGPQSAQTTPKPSITGIPTSHPPVVEDFDDKWGYLSSAISGIFNKRPVACSYQQLHGRVFSIVVQREGRKLYKKTIALLTELIQALAKRINNCPEADFRRVFVEEFMAFASASNQVSDIMLYLNKNYCPQHNKPNIKDATREMFHDCVFSNASVAPVGTPRQQQPLKYNSPASLRIMSIVGGALEQDRAGFVAPDPTMIKAIASIVIGVSPTAFRSIIAEPAIDAAWRFYTEHGDRCASGTTTLRFVQLFFDLIDVEKKRVQLYTDDSLVEEMVETVLRFFFTPQAYRILLNTSPGAWLQDLLNGSDYTADLRKVLLAYSTCGETRPLITSIQDGIIALGTEIALGQTATTVGIDRSAITQQEKSSVSYGGEVKDAKGTVQTTLPKVTASQPIVAELISFTDTFTQTIQATFTSKDTSRLFENEALMHALTKVTNTNPRMAEYLAFAIDAKIRSRCSEFDVTQFSEGLLRLYALLEDKDIFDQSYQFLFSQRLLTRYGNGGPSGFTTPVSTVTKQTVTGVPLQLTQSLSAGTPSRASDPTGFNSTTGSNVATSTFSFAADSEFQVLEHLFLKRFKAVNGVGFGSKLDAMLNDCRQSEVMNVEFQHLVAIIPNKLVSPLDVVVSSSSDDDDDVLSDAPSSSDARTASSHVSNLKKSGRLSGREPANGKHGTADRLLDMTTLTEKQCRALTTEYCSSRSEVSYGTRMPNFNSAYDSDPGNASDSSKVPTYLSRASIPHQLNVTILTKGHWPRLDDLNVRLPSSSVAGAVMFKSFYAGKYRSRILEFCLTQGFFDIRMGYQHKQNSTTPEYSSSGEMGKGRTRYVTLNVPTFAVAPLLLFSGSNALTVAEIASQTGLPTQEAARAVAAFLRHTNVCSSILRVCGSTSSPSPLGRPTPTASATLTADTSIEFNDKFRSSVKFVKIGSVMLREKSEAGVKEATATAHRERSLEISAQIIKVMKSRQTHDHFALVSDVQSGLKHIFAAGADDIKKGIESLINKEFIKRHPTQHGHYVYIS